MVDRDPITEPAGDIVAAQTLLDVLRWVDQGGEALYELLATALLDWKGRRLRDAIAEAGIRHLSERLDRFDGGVDDAELTRLCEAAGLVLSGQALSVFVGRLRVALAAASRAPQRDADALGALSVVLTQRSERDLGPAGVEVLRLREGSSLDATASALDGRLVEHLYRMTAQSNDTPTVTYLRSWFVAHRDYRSGTLHRILRTATVAAHWDVVLALFVSGYPSSGDALAKAIVTEDGTPAISLGSFVARRIRHLEPRVLVEVTQIAMQHLVVGTGSQDAMVRWCLAVTQDVVSSGGGLIEGQSLRAALSTVSPTSDSERQRIAACLELAHQLT